MSTIGIAQYGAPLFQFIERFCLSIRWRVALARVRPVRTGRMPTDDRRILEQKIFRDIFISLSIRRIMFVGCHEYSSWYPAIFEFRPSTRFETVDPDPAAGRFGSKHHHTARFEDLSEDVRLVEQFDVVIVNGVFNYGIDSPEQKLGALHAAERLLKPRGKLVIGYRDNEAVRDFSPTAISPERFERASIPGLECAVYRTGSANGHTFSCFAKRVA